MKKIFAFTFALILGQLVFGQEKEAKPLAPGAGFADSGRFKLYVNESAIGALEYTLEPDGRYQRKFTLAMAGQKAEFFLDVKVDEQGRWQSMEMKIPTDTFVISRRGNSAEYRVKEKTYKIDLSPGHILYDSYGPAFESIMLRNYDMTKKGKQTFSRYIIPSMVKDFELEYKGREIRTVKEREQAFERFDMTLLGISVQIWADADLRIDMFYVPAQYAAFVRDGYEDLLKFKSEDPLLSKPEFAVVHQSVQVPMRDGVRLATDLYFPDNKGQHTKFPVILIRTPYKKEMQELDGNYWARRGYAVAIQDCRGRFASEGVWEPFVNESRDGYDAIEWLGVQEWSNGKVGMIGGSYVGWVQLWAAVEKPPHLVTIIPNVAPPDPFFNIPYEYGVFFIFGSIWWAEILETEATGDLSGKAMSRINERRYEKILKTLPVINLDRKIFGKENRYWRQWILHNRDDAYWTRANFMAKLKNLDIPVFLQSGWFDGDGIGSKLNYLELKKSRNPNQKLILGPWGHTNQSSSRIGDYDFGPAAAPDLQVLYLRWFDYWLKGIDNKILAEPLVQVFVMFANQWLKGDRYPLPQTVFTPYYLSSQKEANTSRGDGRLSTALPAAAGREFDAYVYDPGDPTPHPDWYYQSDRELKKEKSKTIDVEEQKKKVETFHNQVTDERRDILVFQTEPLTEPVSIAGPVSGVLYASSSAPDTDWFMTLMDVDENNKIFPLTHGTIRARFRHSLQNPEMLEKDRIYEYRLDLWQTGIQFRKGHRVRVEVSSALFPFFSRNLNTGKHNELEKKYRPAEQKIFHSRRYPSHVLLPVITPD